MTDGMQAGPARHMAWQRAVKDARMMEDLSLAGAAIGATSRLLIHATVDEADPPWAVGALVRRVWAQVRHEPRNGDALATLEIRDLQGHRLLTLTDAGALVDVVLPTGTYHVTTQVGENRRSYTVALQQDATTDLYLQSHRARQH